LNQILQDELNLKIYENYKLNENS